MLCVNLQYFMALVPMVTGTVLPTVETYYVTMETGQNVTGVVITEINVKTDFLCSFR